MPPGERQFRATTAEMNEISRLAGRTHKEFSDVFFKSAKLGWNWALETMLDMPESESGGKKIDADLRNDFGATALLYAAQNGYHRTADFLISKGADVDAQDKAGSTGLMVAAQGGWIAVVSLLIEEGANPDLVNEDGRTVLHLVAVRGQFLPAQMLIEAGVNPLIRDREGKTALDIAVSRKDDRLEALLFPYTQEKLEAEKLRLKQEAQARTRRNIEILDRVNRKRPPKNPS